MPTGIALAGLVTAGFAEAGWRTIFAVDLVLLAAAVFVTVVAVPRDTSVPRDAEKPPTGALASSLPLAAAFFCFALLFLAVAGLLPAWLVERRGLAAADAGRIAAITTAFGIAGQPSGGLADARRRLARPARRRSACWARWRWPRFASRRCRCPWPSWASRCPSRSADWCQRRPSRRCRWSPRTPRAIGPINGLVAQAGSLGSLAGPPLLARVGRLDGLAVRAAAAAHDRGARRGRRARGQATRFSTTMNQVLPANGTSRPRRSTG